MRHVTFCLPNWLTDWLFLSLLVPLSVVLLAVCLLTELPSVSVHCYTVYLSICLCLSEFMAEWINDPRHRPHLFMSLSVHFLPICLLIPFHPILPLWWYLSHFFVSCVSVLTRNCLCCLVFPHFITRLTDLSLIKHSTLLRIHTRDTQRRRKMCSVSQWLRGGFAVIGEILLFIKVLPLFPTGSCPMPQRTLQLFWAHLKKEPSTWPGPNPLMATVLSYATFWRFPKTVSHVISRYFQPHIYRIHLSHLSLLLILCNLDVSLHTFKIYL